MGKPEFLEPELHRSSIKEGEFYQTYLKAKNRVEYLEEKVYKQNSIFVLRSVQFSLTLVFSKLTIFFLTKKIILNPFSAFIVFSISLADLFI